MATPRVRTRVKIKPAPPKERASQPQRDIFLATFAEDLSEYEARKAARLTRAQVAELKRDPTFVEAMADIVEGAIDKVQRTALQRAIAGDKDLITLVLKSHRPDLYGTRARLDVTVGDVSKLSDEELDARIKELEKARAK